jgi:hypothetical protein
MGYIVVEPRPVLAGMRRFADPLGLPQSLFVNLPHTRGVGKQNELRAPDAPMSAQKHPIHHEESWTMKPCGNRLVFPTSFLIGVHAICSAAAAVGADLAAASPLKADLEQLAQTDDGFRMTQAAVPLVFNAEAYAAVKDLESVELSNFPLAPLGRGQQMTEVTLKLARSRAVSEDSQFVVASVDERGEIIEQPMDTPDVVIFRGKVVGDDESFVFLSFSPHGSHGFIRTQGVTQVISPGPFGEGRTPMIYNMDAIPRGAIHWRDFLCDAQAHDAEAWPDMIHVDDDDTVNAALESAPCRLVDIAIETDKEFTDNLFSGDTDASGAYVATLLSASSEIFEENINVLFDVVFVRLWTGSDPWTGSNTTNQLFQFRDHWNANMGHIERDLAHYLSGRGLGGGVAWLSVVCHSTLGYALSANLNGFFPYPLQDNHSQNWDIMVVTHEFGHNFGTPHTHDFCPPLDECPPSQWFGSCQSQQNCTNQGTIMSYCHLCNGGLGNVLLEFHPVVRQTMLDYLNTVTNCDLDCNGEPQPEIVFVPQDTSTIQAAIQMVATGGEVIVAPGTYNESINFGGKNVTVISSDGPEVTFINASGQNNTVVRFSSGESSQAVLEGFTLTGGTGAPVNLNGTNYILGGGIYLAGSSPTINNCVITGNSAQFGGGAFNNDASPTFNNCRFIETHPIRHPAAGCSTSLAPHPLSTMLLHRQLRRRQAAAACPIRAPALPSSAVTFSTTMPTAMAALYATSSRVPDRSPDQPLPAIPQEGPAARSSTTTARHLHRQLRVLRQQPNHIAGSYNIPGGNQFEAECPDDCHGAGGSQLRRRG